MTLLIDFVFQSGEFYGQEDSFWKDFFIQLLSIMTALVVFKLGVIANEKAKDREHNELMRQTYNYFISIVSSIIRLSREQASLTTNFLQQLETDLTIIPTPVSVPIKDLERFSDTSDHERYYHAYLHTHGSTEDEVNNFRRFYTSIDFLYLSNKMIFERISEARKFDHDRKVNYSNIFKKVSDDAAELVRINSISVQKDEFSEFLNQSLLTFFEKRVDPTAIKEIQDLFVLPLLQTIVKEYRHVDAAAQLAVHLKQANQIYESVLSNNRNVVTSLQVMLNRFTERIELLESLPK